MRLRGPGANAQGRQHSAATPRAGSTVPCIRGDGTGRPPAPESACISSASPTYIGDLKVDLVAPDGSLYNIHNRTGGSADNINTTMTLNLSTEALNGTWKLRVNDNANADTGYINSWSVRF